LFYIEINDLDYFELTVDEVHEIYLTELFYIEINDLDYFELTVDEVHEIYLT